MAVWMSLLDPTKNFSNFCCTANSGKRKRLSINIRDIDQDRRSAHRFLGRIWTAVGPVGVSGITNAQGGRMNNIFF